MSAWMLYAAVMGLVAGAASAAAAAGLRGLGRPGRWAGAAGIAASLALPFLGLERPRAEPPPATAGVSLSRPPAVLRLPSAAAVPRAAAAGRPTPRRHRLDAALAAIWGTATASVLLALLVGGGVLAFHRRRWRTAVVAGERVYVSERVGPAVAGVLRPRIVVPAWALACSEAEQRMMVAHEREHVRARDPLLLACAWIAVAAMPWNPALWWQLRRLRLEVEMDCDARVLRSGHDLRTYGGLLLRVGALGSGAPMGAAALADPRSFLARRIEEMTRSGNPPRWAAAVAIVGALLATSLAAWAVPAPAAPPPFAAALRGTADTLRIHDVADVDEPPRLTNPAAVQEALAASYPPLLRDAGVGGTVTAQVVVEPSGTATLLRIAGSDHPDLTEASRAVLPRMRFRPAMKGGAPARVRVLLPISFLPGPPRGSRADAAGVHGDAGPPLEGVYDPPELDQPPRLTNAAEVARLLDESYPTLLRDAGVGGTVSAALVVGEDGTATLARVLRTDHPQLAEAVRGVVPRMRFHPARKNGTAVRARVVVPFTYRAAARVD